MSRAINPAALGAFLLGAILLLAFGLMLFGGDALLDRGQKIQVYFDGSLTGLNVGAPVLLRGVKVGTVSDIRIDYDLSQSAISVPVVLRIDTRRIRYVDDDDQDGVLQFQQRVNQLVDNGLRARLGMLSLVTGQLYIELDFFPETAIRYRTARTELPPEVPTLPSAFDEIQQTLQALPLQELVDQANNALRTVSRLLGSEDVRRVVVTAGDVLENANVVLSELRPQVQKLAQELEHTLASYRKLGDQAQQQIVDLSATFQRTGSGVRDMLPQTRKTLEAFEVTMVSVRTSLRQLDSALNGLVPVTAESSALMRNLGSLVRDLQSLVRSLERNPQSLLRGRPSTTPGWVEH